MKTFVFVLLSLTGLNGFSQLAPTDCEDLQTGYFAYTEEPQDRFLIKRTAKKQYESFALGQKFEGEIKRVDKKEHIAYVKNKYGKSFQTP